MGVTAAVVVVGEMTVAEVATAVAVVGMATSVAGAVTHNQDLMKVGAVMSLAGGAASIGLSMGTSAASAGMSEAATTYTGDAAANSGFTNVDGTPMNVDPAPTADPTLASTPTGTTTMDLAMSNAGTNVNGPTGSAPDPSSPASTTSASSTPGADSVLNNATAQISGTTSSDANSGFGLKQNAPASQLLNQGFQQSGNSGTGLMKWFDDLNAGTKSALVQALAGGIGGLSSAYSSQQKMALEQLINSQSYQKYQTALANSNAPSTINYTPAASNPNNLLTGTQNQGLINSAAKSSV